MNLLLSAHVPALLEGALAVCLTSILVAFSYQGLYARYMADDFCYAVQMKSQSLWQAETYMYTHWSGRYTTVAFWWIFYRLGPAIAQALAAVAIALWLAAVVWALRGLPASLRPGRAGPHFLLAAVSVVAAGLILNANPGQTLYWINGFVPYYVPLIFLTVLAGLVARGGTLQAHGRGSVAIAILTGGVAFIAGGFSEPYLSLQSGLLLCAMVGFWRVRGRHTLVSCRALWAAVAGTLLSALVTLSAPGDMVRYAQTGDHQHSLLFRIASTLFVEAVILGFAVLPLIKAGVILGAVPSLEALRRDSAGSPSPLARERIRPALLVKLTVVAVVVLVFLVIAPSTLATVVAPPGRVIVDAWFVLLCAAVAWLVYSAAARGSERRWAISPSLRPVFHAAVVLCALLIALWTLSGALGQEAYRRQFAAQWDARQRVIESAKVRGIRDVRVPRVSDPGDIDTVSSDPSFAVNACVAMYYGVRSVRTR